MKVAFFGHSSICQKEKVEQRLKTVVENLILHNGVDTFIVGKYGDFDSLALNICLEYKNKYPNINVFLSLVNRTDLAKNCFGNSTVKTYEDMGIKTIFYGTDNVYYKNRITMNNRYMVDDADIIVCYVKFNVYKSGAKTAVNYAKKQGKQIINIYEEGENIMPNKFEQRARLRYLRRLK